jgi:hypothetical protein
VVHDRQTSRYKHSQVIALMLHLKYVDQRAQLPNILDPCYAHRVDVAGKLTQYFLAVDVLDYPEPERSANHT